MITTIILFLLNGFAYGIFALLPSGSFPFALTAGIQTAYSYAMAFDRYLPVSEMFITMGVVLGIWLTIFSVKSFIFILNWLRGR